ncbi:uncharacterized protein NPIL_455511 [Nephila pilipes]|uniref:Uncharacterized protein n=1 Tax=Nephila pilipes TaxID=299642 RepID=A0A8X6IDH1_NEPPI|nr:uncharacterized protein NPIL_455511 [Nephila pilipes]
MRLASSVSVVLLLRTLHCDGIVSHALENLKKLSTDVGQSTSNSISESSERKSNNIGDKKIVPKQPENEMAPNFVSNEFHGFFSSDQGLSFKYDNSSTESTGQDFIKESPPSSHPRRDFYNYFASRNFHLQPEDKLPLTVNHISQKPLKAHYATAAQAYPEPYDRLPSLQQLKFTDYERDRRSDVKNDDETTTFSRRNDTNSIWNLLDPSNIRGSKNVTLDENRTQNNDLKRFQHFLNDVNTIHKSFKQEETDVDKIESNRVHNNKSTRSARFFNVHRSDEGSMWNWMDQSNSHDDEITPFDVMSMMVDRMDHPSRDIEMTSLWKSQVPAMIAAGLIPLSVMLFAVLPIVIKNQYPLKASKPQVTTTVTNSKTMNNSTEFLAPILDAMETITPRNENSNCVFRTFCEIMKRDQDTWPLQGTIKQMTSFLDDSLQDSFGLRVLINALKDGRCEDVACSESEATSSKLFLHSKLTENGK